MALRKASQVNKISESNIVRRRFYSYDIPFISSVIDIFAMKKCPSPHKVVEHCNHSNSGCL